MTNLTRSYVELYVCECGVVTNRLAGARCGEDARHNIRVGCPAQLVPYVAIGALLTDEALKAGDDANDDVAWRGCSQAVIEAAIDVASTGPQPPTCACGAGCEDDACTEQAHATGSQRDA